MQFSFTSIKEYLRGMVARARQGDSTSSLSQRYTNDWLLLLICFVLLLGVGASFGMLQFFAVRESVKPKDSGQAPGPTITLDVPALDTALSALQKKKEHFAEVQTGQSQIIDPSR